MKVLMYSWEFPPNISGGLGIACEGIVRGLIDQEVEVDLVLPQSSVSDISVKVNGIYYVESSLRPYGPHRASLLAQVLDYAKKAGVAAAQSHHDIIHAHDWLTVLAGIEAKRISHKPLVFHIHALESDRGGDNVNADIVAIEGYGLKEADRVIAVSQYTKDRIVRDYQIAPEKITVVHNGLSKKQIEETVISQQSTKNMVLFLGRVTYQKGLVYFIKAADKILSKRKDIEFIIAGDGDELGSMIEYSASLGISSHVHFTGFLDRESVEKAYSLSKVYVMPSVSEPFGISCLEALAHHLPVIMSKQSGVSEVVNHAIKIDFWDTDEMAAKMMALIDYPALQLELRKNSLQELSYLSWDASVHKIVNLYNQIA